MKRVFAIICILIYAIFLAGCKQDKPVVGIGERAPDFSLRDIDGALVSLSAQKGKVVVLEFWATWCLPCRDSIPEFNLLYNKYKDKNFSLFAVSLDEGSDADKEVKSFIKKHKITYPVLFNANGADASYGIIQIPITFIINKNGIIAGKHFGYEPGMSEKISHGIEALL